MCINKHIILDLNNNKLAIVLKLKILIIIK